MKIQYIFTVLAATSLAFTACEDLDTMPEGSTLTETSKGEIIAAKPERGEAGVRAIFSGMNVYLPNYEAFGSVSRHSDFGFSSVMYFTDANTMDQSADNNGYNWSGNSLSFADRVYTSYESQMVWNDHYKIIYAANSVIAGYSANEGDPETAQGKFFYAQGLAARAYMYFSLAQLYQFTYATSKDKPCVPIITEENSAIAAQEGAPRNTVAEVYAQVQSDIDHAIDLLENSDFMRSDKRYISLAVAYGIRARVNLVMQNWAEAAKDAEAAIAEAASEGIVPVSASDLSTPQFANATEKNWMWGILVAETDDVVSSGIVNWISHCGTFNYGYGQYSGGHQINKKLYNMIPESDVRKGWWSDENGENKYLPKEYTTYLLSHAFAPYTNCKFGTYNGKIDCDVNANDIPMMRVEEMYLIKAEAMAKAGQDGKSFLENFVKTYRDAEYTCNGDVQEAVYFQKRIELWGEGLIWYDFMRLQKDLDRRGGGFNSVACFNIKSNDPILLWRIPQTEIQANPALTDADNNETVPAPKPVADED